MSHLLCYKKKPTVWIHEAWNKHSKILNNFLWHYDSQVWKCCKFLEQCSLVSSLCAHPNTGQGYFIFLSMTTLTTTSGSTNHISRQRAQLPTADCRAGKPHVFLLQELLKGGDIKRENKGKKKNTSHAHKPAYFLLSACFHIRAHIFST